MVFKAFAVQGSRLEMLSMVAVVYIQKKLSTDTDLQFVLLLSKGGCRRWKEGFQGLLGTGFAVRSEHREVWPSGLSSAENS